MWQKAAGGILLQVRLLPDERLAVENPSMETGQISNKLKLPFNTLSFVLYICTVCPMGRPILPGGEI